MFRWKLSWTLTSVPYEARFTLEDPDGSMGKLLKLSNVAQRAEPKATGKGRVRHVIPHIIPVEKKSRTNPGLVSA